MHSEKTPYKLIQEELINISKNPPKNDNELKLYMESILLLSKKYFGDIDSMTIQYEIRCRDFLESVDKNKGLPVRAITSQELEIKENNKKEIDSKLNDTLTDIMTQAVNKYREQVKEYYEISITDFMREVETFLNHLISPSSNPKSIKSEIQTLCKYFRDSIKWGKTFDILKNGCFPLMVSNAFSINSGAIAAQWNYSTRDEEMDYPNHNHKDHDGHIYPIRGTWADKKGLFSKNVNYLDTVITELFDVGCCCSLMFIFNISEIPNNLLSDKARSTLANINECSTTQPLEMPPAHSAEQKIQKSPSEKNKSSKGINGFIRKILGKY